MDLWIPLNFAVFLLAAWVNVRRLRKENTRRGLRFAALFISLYIAVIYLLAVLGVIPELDIRLWLRWMQFAIGVYVVAEAING